MYKTAYCIELDAEFSKIFEFLKPPDRTNIKELILVICLPCHFGYVRASAYQPMQEVLWFKAWQS